MGKSIFDLARCFLPTRRSRIFLLFPFLSFLSCGASQSLRKNRRHGHCCFVGVQALVHRPLLSDRGTLYCVHTRAKGEKMSFLRHKSQRERGFFQFYCFIPLHFSPLGSTVRQSAITKDDDERNRLTKFPPFPLSFLPPSSPAHM